MTADVDRVLADLAGDGVAVIPGVLAPDARVEVLERLWAASRRAEEQGIPTHVPQLDPRPVLTTPAATSDRQRQHVSPPVKSCRCSADGAAPRIDRSFEPGRDRTAPGTDESPAGAESERA